MDGSADNADDDDDEDDMKALDVPISDLEKSIAEDKERIAEGKERIARLRATYTDQCYAALSAAPPQTLRSADFDHGGEPNVVREDEADHGNGLTAAEIASTLQAEWRKEWRATTGVH